MQLRGHKSRSLGAHEASWIHTARPGAVESPNSFSTCTAGSCTLVRVMPSSRYPQNLDQSRESAKPHFSTAAESVLVFFSVFPQSFQKRSTLSLPPKPIHPSPAPLWSSAAATSPPGRWSRGQSLDGVIRPQPQGEAAPWEHRSALSAARAPAALLPWAQRALARLGTARQRWHRICSSQQQHKLKLISDRASARNFYPHQQVCRSLESRRVSDLL